MVIGGATSARQVSYGAQGMTDERAATIARALSSAPAVAVIAAPLAQAGPAIPRRTLADLLAEVHPARQVAADRARLSQ